MASRNTDSSKRSVVATTLPFQAPPDCNSDKLFASLIDQGTISWTVSYHLIRRLGAGGQGVVYLADRVGADGWEVPVAVKFFSQERYADMRAYEEDMSRIAQISARVAVIQQDHLLDVHNFVELQGIRAMSMEWVDGFDLDFLLARDRLTQLERDVSPERWAYLNNVVITPGTRRSRLKPGVAIAIVRECLAALAALHRDDIVHGDLKPANIMLKRTGNVKIIDLGSASNIDDAGGQPPFTPQYAPPEVLEGASCTPFSDLASLGYVLVEMLAGQSMFSTAESYQELLDGKRGLLGDLPALLPDEVLASESLMHLIRTLVAPNPIQRFPSAEAADLLKFGAASFHRELVNSDLASEYETEIRLWLQDLS